MYRITYVLGDLRDPEFARQALLILLGAMVETNVLFLRSHPRTRSVDAWLRAPNSRYDDAAQGVQSAGQEAWQDVPTILRLRRDGLSTAGNRDLAAWRAAELIVAGVPAELKLETRGQREWRVVVVLPNGSIDDPSRGRGWRPYELAERITFVVNLFDGEAERELSHRTLNVLLHALTHIDAIYLRRHPEVPRIRDARVRYMEEPPGAEEWQDVAACLSVGEADCEDLACWRAAELHVREGVEAVPVFRYQRRKDGSYLYHIQVERPDGRIEDPSREQGMR